MRVSKRAFNQNAYLQAGEPGVCNALVIEWLANEGRDLDVAGGAIDRARSAHAAGVKNATFAEHGLAIHGRTDIYKGSNLPQLQAIKHKLVKSPVQKFLVGYAGGGGTGHAIGMIKSAAIHRGFDPNNGYYDITGDNAMTWLFNKLFGAHVKHGYSQFLVYELQSIRQAAMQRRMQVATHRG